jgi:hypothetical protein
LPLLRAGQGLFEAIHERSPVPEVGQRVVGRPVLEFFLGALALGYVAGVEHDPAHRRIFEQAGAARLEEPPRATRVSKAQRQGGTWCPGS